MNKWCLLILPAIVAVLFFGACNPESILGSTENESISHSVESVSDYDWDSSSETSITLNSSSAQSSGSSVSINGSVVTIKKKGYYLISGTLTNGQLVVDADSDIVRIKLNGVSLSNTTTSPFYIKNAKKTIVFLENNSINTISDASSYSSADEPNAALFSNGYLAFTGTGSLTVKGNCYDGIASDDELIINNGIITVTAKDDALRGKDFIKITDGTIQATATSGQALKSDNTDSNGFGYVLINGGKLNVTSSTKDGIHANKRVIINDGTITINAASSQGLKSDSLVVMNGGNVTINASKEGIESPYITMNDGNLSITASDDGFNASKGNGGESDDGSILTINGGYTYINTSKGDALDSNGSANMTGGTVIVQGPSSPPEVAIDINGTFKISGGVLAASGPASGNMIEGPATSSSQYSVLIKFGSSTTGGGGMGGSSGSNSITAGTIINICDAAGNSIITFAPIRACYYFVFSSPEFKSESTYTVYTGGTVNGGTGIGGYYKGGTYSGGTQRGTFTLSSKVTTLTLN